ncbi:hypothetical protein AB0L64_34245 [Kribbella sp. NPDC051936]|uniref:hypothetical protein n=1 Tax=Kribbella sp. NPDC051936 TaxID=3154946 RepID=UPI00341FD47C
MSLEAVRFESLMLVLSLLLKDRPVAHLAKNSDVLCTEVSQAAQNHCDIGCQIWFRDSNPECRTHRLEQLHPTSALGTDRGTDHMIEPDRAPDDNPPNQPATASWVGR